MKKLAQAEEQSLDDAAKAEGVRRLKFENKQLKQDRRERRKYAHRTFCLIGAWVGFVGVLILLQGFNFLSFKLETTIVVTAITTTTASVIGIFLIVANYLFPKK